MSRSIPPNFKAVNRAIFGGSTVKEYAIAEAEKMFGGKWEAVKMMRVQSATFRLNPSSIFANIDLGWHVKRKEATNG